MADLRHQHCTADGKHSPECVLEQLRGRSVEPGSFDRTERVERTQQFFECDWETALLIDDCLGE